MVSLYQCLNLRNISMHMLGAQIDESLYQTILLSCAHFYVIIGKVHVYMPGTQGFKSMHLAAKMYTQGAGCTLNFKHYLYSKPSPNDHLVQEDILLLRAGFSSTRLIIPYLSCFIKTTIS